MKVTELKELPDDGDWFYSMSKIQVYRIIKFGLLLVCDIFMLFT